ncbi:MAG: acyl-CoA desaturase [Gammaproteobacteria bacterium]|nr:MAG: acyl-CoA desaturase [Gammaproteobacteria bacterium]
MFIVSSVIGLIIMPLYGIFVDGYDSVEWVTFALFLFFSGTGITAGYHRLWSHKAYEAHPILKWWLAFWGAASVQNSILVWCAGHRIHHRYVDSTEKDPYSIKRGFWFAHLGWMVRNYESGRFDFNNVNDLKKDKVVMIQHNHYIAFVVASTIALPLFLGYLNGDMWGMFLLVGAFRLVLNHHFTFFINSLCHMWGRQPYTDTNSARDNDLLAMITYGEGYHNFHHFFQTDYRNGVRWWQFDPTKWMIFALEKVKLAYNLRRVPEFKIQEAIVKMQLIQAQNSIENSYFPSKENIKASIEREYQQLRTTLDDWTKLRSEWIKKQRETLYQTTESVKAKLDTLITMSQFKELEYSLQLQKRRLYKLNKFFNKHPHPTS